ncbi:MAG: hypothetical protein ABIJ39_05785 [Chloroflexota bacterium]
MRRIDYRILIGVLLILGGGLMLLEKFEIIPRASSYFWSALLAGGAAVFLYIFFTQRHHWWAALPGFTLAGLSASALLPNDLGLSGLAFLGSIGIGFWAVYISGRDRWWAIIPAGVLMTLGVTSVTGDHFAVLDSGGIFFFGLGVTFLLVALLAKTGWAYIPAGILILFGLLVGVPLQGIGEYVWIGALLVTGLIFIIAAMLRKSDQ